MKIQAAQRLRLRAKAGPDLLDPGLYFSRTQPLIYKGNEHESLDTLAAILTPDGISASDVKYGWPRYPIKLANAASFAGLMALLPRVFNEYLNALRGLGQPTRGLSVQAFMAKLSLAEAGLREKWECKSVRFQIVTEGAEIWFKPVKIA